MSLLFWKLTALHTSIVISGAITWHEKTDNQVSDSGTSVEMGKGSMARLRQRCHGLDKAEHNTDDA